MFDVTVSAFPRRPREEREAMGQIRQYRYRATFAQPTFLDRYDKFGDRDSLLGPPMTNFDRALILQRHRLGKSYQAWRILRMPAVRKTES